MQDFVNVCMANIQNVLIYDIVGRFV